MRVEEVSEGGDAPARRVTTPPASAPHWLDRGLLGALFLLAVSAPHSIAATQFAWASGLLLWIVRLTVRPRPAVERTPLDYALLGFFILTFFAALFSYDRGESIGKLRSASLFTVVYLVAENVRSRRVLRALALTLLASCMVNVLYTFAERAVGRGVKVGGLRAESPLYAAGIRDADTLLEVDGVAVRSPAELERALRAPPPPPPRPAGEGGETARVSVYRVEARPVYEVARDRFLEGATAEERLGIGSWTRGRDWRAAGFYGHYVTYAEVLQLIASLALGLFIARLRRGRERRGSPPLSLLLLLLLLLAASVAGLAAALLMTVTRAPLLGFLFSAFIIVVVGARSRRALLAMALLTLPLAAAGLFLLQQKRQVGFIDRKDGSTVWRLTVYREGLELLAGEPRHLLIGVGMDSIKTHWRAWGLFDQGRLPIGHFHSTPLQLAVERGLPALLVWLALMAAYARLLWHLARGRLQHRFGDGVPNEDWLERGVALGALGGLGGFLASGLVHYNLGDSEVSMVFYFIMGLALVIERLVRRSHL